jgi:hypothetical protein
MRPDGSRGVSADLAAGAKLPALLWASIVLLVVCSRCAARRR